MSTDPQTDPRARIVAALRSITVIGGAPPTQLVPVIDSSSPSMARIADWQPLDGLVDALLAAAPVAAPPTGQAGLRERIAEALVSWTYRGQEPDPETGILETVRANAYSRADAVLLVLLGPIPAGTDTATWTAIRAIQLMNEAGRERDAATAEPHRLALSTALGLGTSAPWDAIRERAAELAVRTAPVDRTAVLREVANIAESLRQFDPATGARKSAQVSENVGILRVAEELRRLAAETPGPETQGEAHPPTSTWKVESPRRDSDTWASWGATYDERDWARERYESAIGNAPARPFRLVRATTTYTVEAEHAPAVDVQFGIDGCTCIPFTRRDGTPRYCGPTDTVDMISGWERGTDCLHHAPAVVAEPGKEA